MFPLYCFQPVTDAEPDSDRIAEYEMKLMDIDADTLNIPDTDYDARVSMPSAEFTRIVRDLSQLGESVRIEVSKEGVRFISDGEAANGNILLRQSEASARKGSSSKKEDDDEEEEEEARESEDEDEEGGKKKRAKKEKVKKEDGEDVEMNEDEDEDREEFKPKGGDDEDEDDEEEGSSKKRKKAPAKVRACACVRMVCSRHGAERQAGEESQEGSGR